MQWPLRLPRQILPTTTQLRLLRSSELTLRRPSCQNFSSIASGVKSDIALVERLLGPCGDRESAKSELRWLSEHVERTTPLNSDAGRAALSQLVDERATGKPLQYILGTEFFGDLELECRPGVLIPRQETAASITHLVGLLSKAPRLPYHFRILDLCTGSGCIPFLFQHSLNKSRPDINARFLGVDMSAEALRLARDNKSRLLEEDRLKSQKGPPTKKYASKAKLKVRQERAFNTLEQIEFVAADVLAEKSALNSVAKPDSSLEAALTLHSTIGSTTRSTQDQFFNEHPKTWQVLICNPPYISPNEYLRTTSRSVREYEPKLALVPPPSSPGSQISPGDTFFPRLLEISKHVEAKVVLFEVADMDQAVRVARMAKSFGENQKNPKLDQQRRAWDGIQIWRDQPGQPPIPGEPKSIDGFNIVGRGNGRSVFCWKYAVRAWYRDIKRHPRWTPRHYEP